MYNNFIAKRGHASMVYAVVVCLPVASHCSTEMAKRITQTTPQIAPRDASFLLPNISAKTQTGSPPTEAPNAGGVR